METFYKIIGLLTVFAEGFIVFAVSGSMCGKKYKKIRHVALVAVFGCVYTLLMTCVSSLEVPVVLMLAIAVVFSFAVNFAVSKGSML